MGDGGGACGARKNKISFVSSKVKADKFDKINLPYEICCRIEFL